MEPSDSRDTTPRDSLKKIDPEDPESSSEDGTGNYCSTSNAPDTSNESLILYFYTQGDSPTSEVFKMEMNGFPSHVTYFQMKNFLKQLNLKHHKIKLFNHKPKSVNVMFTCKNDYDHAVQTLLNHDWKEDRKVSFTSVNSDTDPLLGKRKVSASEDSKNSKLRKTENEIDQPLPVMIKDAVTPLWRMPYSEQLRKKQEKMFRFIENMSKKIIKFNPTTYRDKSAQRYKPVFCPLLPIVPSPVTIGFCNKWEFRVGLHPETEQPIVGVCVGSMKESGRSVAEVSPCRNFPDCMLKAVELFQDYIRESNLSVFNPKTQEGHWHKLTVRTSFLKQLMLIVVMHPQSLTEEEIESEKKAVVDFFSESSLEVTSIFWQRFYKRDQERPPVEHVFGSEFIEEELSSLMFRISPGAFFQTNTRGTQLLYKTVTEFTYLNRKTILLDLCCGTGALGIYLAKGVQRVIGIELCKSSVEDARHNAERNGVTNAEFICGPVESEITGVLERLKGHKDVVAILDPPLNALSTEVTHAIRVTQVVKRLVYLTSNPETAMKNFIELCRPSESDHRRTAFKPMKSVAVDLFPETRYCELIVQFERQELNS